MIFNEQIEQRTAYNRQALEEAKKALEDLVAKPRKDDEDEGVLTEGIRLDRRFPIRELFPKDLFMLGIQSISRSDILYMLLVFAAVTAIGMVAPYVAELLYEDIIPSGIVQRLLPLFGLLMGVSLGTVVFETVRSVVLMRIRRKVDAALQAAMMARTYAMPTTFFRKFSSGDMSNRVMMMTYLSQLFTDGVITQFITLIFSFVYLYQVFFYAHALLPYCLLILLANILFMLWEYMVQWKMERLYTPRKSKLQGLLFGLFSGIQKIKTTGSEVRAFSKWAKAYNESRPSAYGDYLARFSAPISSFISLAGWALLYYQAVNHQIALPEYMAFMVAFGMVSSGITTFAQFVPMMTSIRSSYKLLKPIMEEVPESYADAPKVDMLSGGIEVHNLSFRYNEDSPYVLKDLNLKINPGEYVAIVGRSGCGKSTLIRLLLGFEKAESGAIFYDTYNIDKVDKQSLRQHIGTCMQDGELFSGSLLSNITITAPWAKEEDAWRAARLAAMEEDIKKMPMQMHTIMSDGGMGVSGGQRQRILIARALVNKPSVLFFDEATSALDNITQKRVAENLDSLRCTRICVAHRLSTIVHCDRIIVLDGGKVVEEGTYQELLDRQGMFYDLVKQQL